MRTVNILGINVNNLSKKELLARVAEFLDGRGQKFLVTLNPEIILHSHEDEEYFFVLNEADIAIPDGTGLKIASWFLGANLERITGADLVADLLELAVRKNKKVLILNWKDGLSSATEISEALKIKYPQLNFLVTDCGRSGEGLDFNDLSAMSFDILFVAFGAPWQEKFVYHNLSKLPSIKLAAGIGGTFDFITGKIVRAPLIFRRTGLEWFWRVLKQPRGSFRLLRLKRIYNAVMKFPLRFCYRRFITRFFYRPNVACFAFRKVDNSFQVLIVERQNEMGHWQLPQGGTDGEDIKSAGMRELREELNCDKFRYVVTYKNLFTYKFDFSSIREKKTGYKGQKQSLLIAEFLGTDSDIKINFWDHRAWRWVDINELEEAVHPYRKPAMKIFLEKFNEIKGNL